MKKRTIRSQCPTALVQVCVILFIGKGVLCLPDAKAIADENKKTQFLSEYVKPEGLLKKKYAGVEIGAIVTERDSSTAPLRWSKLRFLASDKAMRLDAERERKDPRSGNVERYKSSIVVNPAKASARRRERERFDKEYRASNGNACCLLSCPWRFRVMRCPDNVMPEAPGSSEMS